MQHLPVFHILSHRWILFRVKTEEERQKLLNNSWQWGPFRLILKKWKVDFEANKEPQNVQQVWAILLGLPMMFWKKGILEAIGGKIGKFIALEENWEQKVDRRCAKILIKVDLHAGSFEEILLELHETSWRKRLDYWKIPFLYFSCRKVGHIAREIPNPGIN